MKIFIDTGNLKDIEKLVPLGIIDGITTNPSLLAKEPGDYKDNLKKICQIVKGPTSAEVVELEADAMILPKRFRPKTKAGKVGMVAGGIVAGLIALDLFALVATAVIAASAGGR